MSDEQMISRRELLGKATAIAVAPCLPALGMRPQIWTLVSELQASAAAFSNALPHFALGAKQAEYLGYVVESAAQIGDVPPSSSHEFYTLLNAIRGFPEMLTYEMPDDAVPRVIADAIARKVIDITTLVEAEQTGRYGVESQTTQ